LTIRCLVPGEIKREESWEKNPSSAIYEANVDISAMYGRMGLKKRLVQTRFVSAGIPNWGDKLKPETRLDLNFRRKSIFFPVLVQNLLHPVRHGNISNIFFAAAAAVGPSLQDQVSCEYEPVFLLISTEWV